METSTKVIIGVVSIAIVGTIAYFVIKGKKPVVEDKSANENKGYEPVQSESTTSNNTQNNSSAIPTEEQAINPCKRECFEKFRNVPVSIGACISKCHR